MGPKPPHLSPAGSNFSVNRDYSNLNNDQVNGEKKEEYLPDEVLDLIGARNKTLLVGMCSASFIWVLGAMPLMASGFTSDTNNATMQTIIDDFNLTGENAYLAEIPTSAYMAGNMAGGTFLAQASDRFGRRPVLLLSLFMFSLSGILSSFSPSIFIYSLLRACQGCFYTGSCVTGWVAGYEMSPTKMRPFTTLLFGMAWLVGYSAVAPLAYNAESWRQLVFYTALPTMPFALWIYFFLPETLHFLVSKRKTKEMGVWLEKVCGQEKLQISPEQILSLQESDNRKVNVVREICSNRIFLIYTIAMMYLWICDTFTYFGLSLYSTELSGNKWMNYLLMGLVELPAYIFTPMLIDKFGRRSIVAGSHFVAGLAFLSLLASPAIHAVVLSIWLVGKSAITLSFMALFVYASEVFPTDIRNASVGLCVVVARIGGIAAPQIKNMALLFSKMPEMVLSTVCLLGGLATLLLPETANRPLPASIKESTEKKALV